MGDRVRVTVPASTANLGQGFDCMALALGLRNTIELSPAETGFEMTIDGEGADRLRRDRGNLILRAADALWKRVGFDSGGLSVRAGNGIPLGSGLGSSAAATVGGLVAANALAGEPLSNTELLKLAYDIEGHPDNASAALLGGLTLVSVDGDDVLVERLDVPPQAVVIALPDVRLSTRDARRALPSSVPLRVAVFNIGRSLLVARALQSGDYAMLGRAMEDRLHQPYRRGLIPGFDAAERAAKEFGAAAVALSGAGPSVAAFAPDRHAEIAEAMQKAFERQRIRCRTFVLPVEAHGAQVG